MPKKQVPIKEGFFTMPLSPLEHVRLNGSKCRKCGEVFFGKIPGCENCGSQDMEQLPLSQKGKLYTYTVIEHRPPGDYKGPDPFVPFGEGFVELPEGVRIVAPLTESRNLKVGMELELVVHKLFEDANGDDVIAYKFKPV